MNENFILTDYDLNELFSEVDENSVIREAKLNLIKELSTYSVKELRSLINIKRRWDDVKESGRKNPYKDIDIKSLVHDYRYGASVNQLSKKYDCSYTLIVDRLKKAGVYRTREQVKKDKANGYDWVARNKSRGY